MVYKDIKIILQPTKKQEHIFFARAESYARNIKLAYGYVGDLKNVTWQEIRGYLNSMNDEKGVSYIIKQAAFDAQGGVRRSNICFPVRCDAPSHGNKKSRIYSEDLASVKIPSVNGMVQIASVSLVGKNKSFLFEVLNGGKIHGVVEYDGRFWMLSYRLKLQETE